MRKQPQRVRAAVTAIPVKKPGILDQLHTQAASLTLLRRREQLTAQLTATAVRFVRIQFKQRNPLAAATHRLRQPRQLRAPMERTHRNMHRHPQRRPHA